LVTLRCKLKCRSGGGLGLGPLGACSTSKAVGPRRSGSPRNRMIIGSTSVYVYPSSALIDRREARRARASLLCGVLLPNPAFSSSTLPYLLLCSSIPSFISLILSYLSSTVPSFRPSSSQSSTRAARSGCLVGSWMLARARFACPASWARPRSLATDAVFGSRARDHWDLWDTVRPKPTTALDDYTFDVTLRTKDGSLLHSGKLLPMIKVDERFISFDGRSPSAAGGRVRWVRFRYDW
jgi:hypothetical protein